VISLWRRLQSSAVVWSWGFNFLRLASGLLLLPLLLTTLTKPDLGMYYVFLSLGALVVVLDFGFSPTIGRFVSYAMGGATKLAADGIAREECGATPNYGLLHELLSTARIFYGILALGALVLLGTFGSYMIWLKVGETSSPALTWTAWAIAVAAIAAETYFNLWNMFLRNMNQVLSATRISMLAYGARLLLACVLLLLGGGLLSLPVASLVTSFIILVLSRKRCLQTLAAGIAGKPSDWRQHLRTIWPNSWKLGLYFGGAYLATNANMLVCSTAFGLEASAGYGLSIQVIGICAGLSAAWTSVKWPIIGQLLARRQTESVRRLFWPRLWLHLGTFMVLAVAAISVGPWLIRAIGSDKEMLPFFWLLVLASNGSLEQHCSVWNTLIAMGNRLPMLVSSLVTNGASLTINIILVHLAFAEPGMLALGPLISGAVFNYWYWPRYGARSLDLSWFEFARHGFCQAPRGARLARQGP
jgi:O-antigen/teichoic acid export membrane protein